MCLRYRHRDSYSYPELWLPLASAGRWPIVSLWPPFVGTNERAGAHLLWMMLRACRVRAGHGSGHIAFYFRAPRPTDSGRPHRWSEVTYIVHRGYRLQLYSSGTVHDVCGMTCINSDQLLQRSTDGHAAAGCCPLVRLPLICTYMYLDIAGQDR